MLQHFFFSHLNPSFNTFFFSPIKNVLIHLSSCTVRRVKSIEKILHHQASHMKRMCPKKKSFLLPKKNRIFLSKKASKSSLTEKALFFCIQSTFTCVLLHLPFLCCIWCSGNIPVGLSNSIKSNQIKLSDFQCAPPSPFSLHISFLFGESSIIKKNCLVVIKRVPFCCEETLAALVCGGCCTKWWKEQ